MPRKPLSPCAVPGCPEPAVSGGRCAAHQRAVRRQQVDDRPSASARGYDRKWRKNRARFLKHNPTCVACGAEATEVDHITPKAQGGGDEWGNLRAFCKSCHSKRHAREREGAF